MAVCKVPIVQISYPIVIEDDDDDVGEKVGELEVEEG